MPWRRNRLPTPVFLGFPGGSDGKESTCNAGELGLIPELGRSHGRGHGNHYNILAQESHGQRSLAGCSPWGQKKSDTTEQLTATATIICSSDVIDSCVSVLWKCHIMVRYNASLPTPNATPFSSIMSTI